MAHLPSQERTGVGPRPEEPLSVLLHLLLDLLGVHAVAELLRIRMMVRQGRHGVVRGAVR